MPVTAAPQSVPAAAAAPKHAVPSTASLIALVHGFYADVRADPLLGPVFEEALRDRWEPHLARMVDFWSTVAMGSKSFSGNVFGKHMALSGVTPAHFAAWVRLWHSSFFRMAVTCTLTVCSVTPISCAICLLSRPSAT